MRNNSHSSGPESLQEDAIGLPVLVTVRDLNWKPSPLEAVKSLISSDAPQDETPQIAPEPEPIPETHTQVLAEEPPVPDETESLIDSTPEPVAEEQPLIQHETTTPEIATEPEPAEADENAAEKPAVTKLSYIRREVANHRGSSGKSVWTNRLYLGGMAISLLVASVWVFSGGDSADTTPEGATDQMVVETDGLHEAPAWDGLDTPSSDSIVIETQPTTAPRIATLPTDSRTNPQLGSNSSAAPQLPTLVSPVGAEQSTSPDVSNPAWTNLPSPASTPTESMIPQNSYVPSFGPSQQEYSETMNQPEIGSGSSIPYQPSFGPTSEYTDSNPAPQFDSEPASQPSNSGKHWALVEEQVRTNNDSQAAPVVGMQGELPQIINGTVPASSTTEAPAATVPPNYANTPVEPQSQFGFGPYNSATEPYRPVGNQPTSSVPRTAGRAQLKGIETYQQPERR